jgi:large subunit GTPase 1
MGKKSGPVLGHSLMKSNAVAKTKKTKRVAQQEGFLHTTDMQDGYDWGRLNLQSVTEDDTYTDFMNTAELAGREFDAEKWNVKLLDAQTRQVYIDTTEGDDKLKVLSEEEKVLPIPRRPQWTGLTAEQLKEEENKNFLEWRRSLASIQEDYDCVVTPYEKNLEFWRQLWRVIERSDLVIQIVDSRHPLVFRSEDLEKYVKEVSQLKNNLVLINKADLLTEDQRLAWADYFSKENINFAFFSAISEEDSDEEKEDSDEEKEDSDEENEDKENTDDENEDKENKEDENSKCSSKTDILTSDQLVDLFRSYKRFETEEMTVGFIGYPNVGKSSTINKLLTFKKVRVSDTPGKTKHFQTLLLTDDITLCDCPGLVMPSICNSKAGMVLQGILPIDQLRDHVPVINLLLTCIPPHVLESRYGLVLPREGGVHAKLSSEQLLTAYGTLRGFMTSGGRPDQSRAARIILKDYVSGKILFCEAPPGMEQLEYHKHELQVRRVFKDEAGQETEARRLQQMRKTKTEEIDSNFFAGMSLGAHVKGSKKLEGRFSDKNKSKKKTRIVYKDLDPKRHGHV